MEELAINGGKPVRTEPWRDNITTGEEEKRAVIEVLDRGHLSLFEGSYQPDPPFSFWGGPKVQQLEEAWGSYYGAKYAVSMNSATSGLYAAVAALGIGYGDEVIVSPYTMSASAVCVLVSGAIPVFADVELATGCLEPKSIDERITPRTRAILVVHQFGIPADMDAILDIARRHKLKVIEDCAQAHGAKYKGRHIGTLGDIGVFSLNVNKTIQCGEGAVCVTNDEELRYRMALIRNHGEAVVAAAKYQNITNIIGFNFRMTEIHAAIAIEQLKKLERFNQARLELVGYLNGRLAQHECLVIPGGRQDCHSTYYVYPLRYLPEKLGIKRAEFTEMLKAEGIRFSEGYVPPLYLQPVYQNKLAFKHGYPFSAPENRDSQTNYHRGACPNAERLHFEEMLLNEYVRLPHTKDDMEDIARAVDKVVSRSRGR
jgi:perosamine synthetase